MRRIVPLFALSLILLAGTASAGTILVVSGSDFNNGVITGEATVEIGGGKVIVDLENLSPWTRTAGQLLTGFGFRIDGFNGGVLDVATAKSADVDGTGAFTVSPTEVDLLTVGKGGKATWSLTGDFFLQFNPDAEYGIIGVPHSSGGDYSDSNGGIKDNNGHNPFSYLSAHFEISVPGITDADAAGFRDAVIYFGTDFAGRVPSTGLPPQAFLPLPSSAWMAIGLLAALGVARRLGRRRRLAA